MEIWDIKLYLFIVTLCAQHGSILGQDPCECPTELHECVPTLGASFCLCRPGYTPNGGECVDVNDCDADPGPCDPDISTCVNEVGSHTCACFEGFTHGDNEQTCVDRNECAETPDPCDRNSTTCANTFGSYACLCRQGFEEGGTPNACNDTNECAEFSDNCDTATTRCVNTPGGFNCECLDGFQTDTPAEFCVDVDECTGGTAECDEDTTTCTNSPGAYECECLPGFGRLDQLTCSDVDECALGTDSCDVVSSTCINTIGSYQCMCNVGYFQGGDEKTCLVTPIVRLAEGSLDVFESDGTATITVALSDATLTEEVTVFVDSEGITASEAEDFAVPSPSVTLQPGETEASFVVNIIDDEILESLEEFRLDIVQATGLFIDEDASGVLVHIHDDDVAQFALHAGEDVMREGSDEVNPITIISSNALQEGDGAFIIDIMLLSALPVETLVETGCSGAASDGDVNITATRVALSEDQTIVVDLIALNDELAELTECVAVVIGSVTWEGGREDQIEFASTPTIIRLEEDDQDTADIVLGDTEPDVLEGSSRAIDISSSREVEGFSIVISFNYSSPRLQLSDARIFGGQSPVTTATLRGVNNDIVDGPVTSLVNVTMQFVPTIGSADVSGLFDRVSLVSSRLEVTVEDDDVAYLSFAYTIATIIESAGTIRIPFSLSIMVVPELHPRSIGVSFLDQSAFLLRDYGPVPSSVGFPQDGIDGVVEVPIIDNDRQEEDRNFVVTFAFAGRADIVVNQTLSSVTVTILDDDLNVFISTEVSLVTVQETDGMVLIDFELSREHPDALSFDLLLEDRTAVSGSDYSANVTTITIPSGTTRVTGSISIIDDDENESTEEFGVMIVNPSSELRVNPNRAVTSVVIVDDDTTRNGLFVSMSRTVVEVSEDDGMVQIPIEIGSGINVNNSVIIRFVATGDTAEVIRDFEGEALSIFAPQASSLAIRIEDDGIAEEDESFSVRITSVDGGNIEIRDTTTLVRIHDDDTACLRIDDVTAEEEDQFVAIYPELPYKFEKDITIDFTTRSQTARRDQDYQLLEYSSIVIPANQVLARVAIPIVDDELQESDEYFLFEAIDVTSPVSLCGGVSTATITIPANDPGPMVTYCPTNIVYYTVNEDAPVAVTWERAEFVKGQDLIATYTGVDVLQTQLYLGETRNVVMTAEDIFGRRAECSFTVSVSSTPISDLKEYNITMELLTSDEEAPDEGYLKEWLNYNYRLLGSCSRDFAGVKMSDYRLDERDTMSLSYRLFLVKYSECCLQDILFQLDIRLGDQLSSPLTVNSNLPDVLFYRMDMEMEVQSGVDRSIDLDGSNTLYAELREAIITQLTANLSSTRNFIGVCLNRLEESTTEPISSVTYIEVASHDPPEYEEVEDLTVSYVTTSIILPEGVRRPEENSVHFRETCRSESCHGNGKCYLTPGNYITRCQCDRGFTVESSCRDKDPRYCVAGDEPSTCGPYGIQVSLPTELVGTRLYHIDPNPCEDITTDEGTVELLEVLYGACIGGQWNCTVICNATLHQYLSFLLTIEVSEDNVDDVSEQLAEASLRFEEEGDAGDLEDVAELVERISNSTGPKPPEIVDNLVVTLSNIINVDQEIIDELGETNMLNNIIEAFDQSLIDVIVDNGTHTYSKNTANIATMVIEGNSSIVADLAFASQKVAGDPDVTEEFQKILTLNSSEVTSATRDGVSTLIQFPRELRTQLETGSSRATYAVYRTPSLFSSRHFNDLASNRSMYDRRLKKTYGVNTMVVSSSVASGDTVIKTWDDMNATFRQWYRLVDSDDALLNVRNANCTFWSFRADGGRGNWSTNGCKRVGFDAVRNMVQCECSHLTNFAVLRDIYEHDSLSDIQYTILEAITFFGCAASILGLSLTVFAFTTQSNLRMKRPNQILIVLCLHLLGMYTCFLVMAALDSERTRRFLPPLQCSLLAGVMHFMTLASLCWMAVEGLNMYFLFVRIVNTHINRFMLKAFIFAEGVPFVIVVLTAVLTSFAFDDDYARQSVCFVNGPFPVVFGVGLPIAFVVLTNLILYILVMRRLGRRVVSSSNKSDKMRRQQQIKRIQNGVSIFLLMGLTWGLGYFCFIPVGANVAFAAQLLFSALNSMQGYLIFMFYCMRNPEFRKRWRKWCFCPSTFPFSNSLSSTLRSNITGSKVRNTSTSNNGFQADHVPVSSVERRRTSGPLNSFRELNSHSVA